jgi:hypothetical protein
VTHVQKVARCRARVCLPLDLGVTLGPEKPDHIETILSGPLPILIGYKCLYREITGSALWRMDAAIRHHDRVRDRSPLKGRVPTSTNSSIRLIAPFPY